MDPLSGIAFAAGAGSFLFDVFDKAVQAYRIYSTAKSLGSTSAHLTAKLLIEERRLLQWGEGIGIKLDVASPETKVEGLDERLEQNDALYQTILRTLTGIEDALTNVENLKAKYGFRLLEDPNLAKTTRSKDAPSVPPYSKLSASKAISSDKNPKDSEALKEILNRSNQVQASISICKKFQWAVKDQKGFEMLLDHIRYYNDSLYSLLPKESAKAIAADVLANLMETATSERLLQYSSLAAQGLEGPDHNWASISRYEAISSAANVSLNIREAHPSSLDLSIEEKYINYDGDDTRMGTFSKPAYKPTRVYVEILRRFRYTSTEDDDPSRKDTLNRMKELCVLLKEPRSFGFTTMTCLGIITNFADFDGGDIKLVYELPAAADPLERPVSLHDLLTLDDHRSKEPPDVDARFSLATKLANALHEMHSTGWLHRDVSSKNIHFFRGKDISSCNTYDIERPYITGFDAARSFTANRSLAWYQWDFDAVLHQHPGYLLEKFWAQRHAERGNTGDKLFYMPRHDYYSIGLVLLQIGMWKDLYSLWPSNIPLIPLNPTPESSETTPGEKSENLTLNMWFARLEFPDELNPGNEDEHERGRKILNDYIEAGLKLRAEEEIYDLPMSKDSASDEGTAWDAWDATYGPYLLRQEALRICQEKLGSRMGRRYREAIRRCLATDFGVTPRRSSKNPDWLRAFNWKVVQELDKCCA